MYNPKEYWSKIGADYKAKSERDDELLNLGQCIRKYVPQGKSVLEVGAGNGRVYHFLHERMPEIEGRYKMCDFVDSFRNACRQRTGILPRRWNGKTLPYSDGKFSLVVSFSVLLHVPSSDIEKFIKEHIRVSSRYLFIATWYEAGDDWASQGPYFRHDYFLLFKENKLRVVETMKCSHPRRANWLLERMDAKF